MLRAEPTGEVGRLEPLTASARVAASGDDEPTSPEPGFRVEPRATSHAVPVERVADLVEVLGLSSRVVELVVVHQVAEPLDRAAHLGGRLVRTAADTRPARTA